MSTTPLPEQNPVYGPFFGVMGAASAIIFSGKFEINKNRIHYVQHRVTNGPSPDQEKKINSKKVLNSYRQFEQHTDSNGHKNNCFIAFIWNLENMEFWKCDSNHSQWLQSFNDRKWNRKNQCLYQIEMINMKSKKEVCNWINVEYETSWQWIDDQKLRKKEKEWNNYIKFCDKKFHICHKYMYCVTVL